MAARLANTYANAYIDFSRKKAVDNLLAASQQVQAKLDDLQRQINDLDAQLALPAPSAKDDVKTRRDQLIQQQGAFKQRLDQIQVDANLSTGSAQLVTPASTPTSPIKPKPLRTGVLALVAGLMLGLGLAFLRERLDDSIKTKEDLEQAARALPVLAVVPMVRSWKGKAEARTISVSDPSSSVAEAYRTLRASIQFMGIDRPVRTIQVTSASAKEGKSTTVANLGVALARTGQSVVVMCADLRRPRIHEFFGLSNKVGLTSVLLGEVGLEAALQQVPEVDRLRVLASGPLPPNPSELLQSRRAAEAIANLAENNIVLIDTPPTLPVSDALVVSKRVDATLVVCSAGGTNRKDLARAVQLLEQVEAPLIGTVLNGAKGEGTYGYAYGYYRPYATYSSANGDGNGAGRSSKKTKQGEKARD
jgi:non-specific protein-tyrosine kinase